MSQATRVWKEMILLTCQAYLEIVFGLPYNHNIHGNREGPYYPLIEIDTLVDVHSGHFSFVAYYTSSEESPDLFIVFSGTGCVDQLFYETPNSAETAFGLSGQVCFEQVKQFTGNNSCRLPTGTDGNNYDLFDRYWAGVNDTATDGEPPEYDYTFRYFDFGLGFGIFDAYDIGSHIKER